MARLIYPLALALTLPLALTACGSKNSSNNGTDAPVVITTDAPPPDAGMPDALVCVDPQKDCGTGVCVDTSSDEQNCGACGMVCQGGAYCKPQPAGCTCPAGFLPASMTGIIHQTQSVGGTNIQIAAATDTQGTQTNGLIFIAVTFPTVNTDYTLKSGISFTQPNVLAAYNVTLGGTIPSADAYYQAVAGTLRFSTATCDTTGFEFKGTIKNATFQGATVSGMNIQVDPNGCTFTVANMAFDITVPDPPGPACTQ
jgi:hypothetical protein